MCRLAACSSLTDFSILLATLPCPEIVTRPSPSHERKSLLCPVAWRGDVVVRIQQAAFDPRACTSLLVGLPWLDSADLDLVCALSAPH